MQQQQAAPEGIAILTGRRNRGTMGTIVERFAAGVGTPNLVTYDPFDPAPIRKAMELVTGTSRLPAVDFANANFLLSLNANLFETFLSPVRYIYSYGQMRPRDVPGFAADSCMLNRGCHRRLPAPTSGCRSSREQRACSRSQSPT